MNERKTGNFVRKAILAMLWISSIAITVQAAPEASTLALKPAIIHTRDPTGFGLEVNGKLLLLGKAAYKEFQSIYGESETSKPGIGLMQNVTWHYYYAKGISVAVDGEGIVQRMCFYTIRNDGYMAAQVVMDTGLTTGASPDAIRKIYGEPLKEPSTIGTKQTMVYENAAIHEFVNFQFADEKLAIIVIGKPVSH